MAKPVKFLGSPSMIQKGNFIITGAGQTRGRRYSNVTLDGQNAKRKKEYQYKVRWFSLAEDPFRARYENYYFSVDNFFGERFVSDWQGSRY
jgi:hypothetical protein